MGQVSVIKLQQSRVTLQTEFSRFLLLDRFQQLGPIKVQSADLKVALRTERTWGMKREELIQLAWKKKREQEKCERRHLLITLIRQRFTDDALGRHKISLADWDMTAEQFTCLLLWPIDVDVPPSAIKDDFKSWLAEHGRALAKEMMEQIYGEKIFFVYDRGTSMGHITLDEGLIFYENRNRTGKLGKVELFSLPRSAKQAWQSLDPNLRNTFPERVRFVQIN